MYFRPFTKHLWGSRSSTYSKKKRVDLLLLLLLAASHKIEVQIFRSAQLSQNKLINFHPEKTLQAEPRCTVTIVTQMLSVLLNAFIYPNPHTYYPTTQRERSPKLKRNPYTDINASHGDIKMMGTLIQHVAVLFCHWCINLSESCTHPL